MSNLYNPPCTPVEMIAGSCNGDNCRWPQKTVQLDPSTRAGASCVQQKNHTPQHEVPLFINNITGPSEV